jgi:redox-sensitive bicupin YhaK (pirin superfamily)
MKQIQRVVRNVHPHWVGDGFPVRSLFSYGEDAAEVSPFLLLDYGGPHEFAPTNRQLGVGEHPHCGFETVTIVYEGSLEHRDSTGSHGKIGPGDVQWMTAASGVVHAEFHSREFARTGGHFEMVQLWVNLPAREKMSTPRYQEILDRQIPRVNLDRGAGTVRVIAGEWAGTAGPARTVTPLCVFDLRLNTGHDITAPAPDGHTAVLLVQHGRLTVNGQSLAAGELAILERLGGDVSLHCDDDAMVLMLTGEPIYEPVVGQGPFVMNTQEEIQQAMHDYQSGQLGQLTA